ncbi:hypothetical protein [Agromyces sp. LHK192]|uniref:hypothetical protein n=1 Tax=Agromyces sp. LHK192 TaxID=2498704 RepID=UPI000FD78D54|nr:hypothetical protein [Agromyces sp. LHK192]
MSQQRSNIANAIGLTATGAVCGLAWAASLRAFMSGIAGHGSRYDWTNTFVGVLLPGLLTGAILGYAEFRRRTGGTGRWRRLALAPLSFLVVVFMPVPGPTGVLGEAATALLVTAVAVAGGVAFGTVPPMWARIVCGVVAGAAAAGLALVGALSGERMLAVTEARGAYLAVLGASLLVVLYLAESIPFRRAVVVAEAVAHGEASAGGEASVAVTPVDTTDAR